MQNRPLYSNGTEAVNFSRTKPNGRTASQRKDSVNSANSYPSKRINGHAPSNSDEDIPENMYRPEKDDPEGWIHRDKLAKIESEELQAAGINLATARSRSQSRNRNERQPRSAEREEKQQRLQSPAEIEEEQDRASWDFRLPEEIDSENHAAAAQMYSNPLLRKSGSKIPVLTSSPHPIPAERYERDTPISRKRAASGTMSFEGDLHVSKTRGTPTNRTADDSESSSAVASSKQGSPQKPRSKSATLTATPSTKQLPANRKTSAPPRNTASPNQRPGTRSGEQDRPRTAINRPEGDPPWLATMYKPDPRLPPDQQLIPTLAKKQMQAQWAEEGAVPKAYDRDFTPIAIHSNEEMAEMARSSKRNSRLFSLERTRTPSPSKDQIQPPLTDEKTLNGNADDVPLKLVSSEHRNSYRPGTSGSITGAYSTMPKVTSPAVREQSPRIGAGSTPRNSLPPANGPAPTRLQAQNLDQEDEKVKKGCGCCIVM